MLASLDCIAHKLRECVYHSKQCQHCSKRYFFETKRSQAFVLEVVHITDSTHHSPPHLCQNPPRRAPEQACPPPSFLVYERTDSLNVVSEECSRMEGFREPSMMEKGEGQKSIIRPIIYDAMQGWNMSVVATQLYTVGHHHRWTANCTTRWYSWYLASVCSVYAHSQHHNHFIFSHFKR